MWKYIIAVAIIIVFIFLYVYSYKMNEETEKPEGCEDLECNSCKTDSCSHRK
ncbi:MAG: hypothetical protein JEZ05_01740 [Tenericutes bacterium]|nr:hypothetical protein [Mycoplasmatota bacterium]